MSSTGPTSSSRALEAILPLVAAGQPYEAHQKARTFAARYTKSGAHAITIDVLFQSARELLKAGNPGSGTDLALLLLESYERTNEPVSDVSRGAYIVTMTVRCKSHILADLCPGRLTQLIVLVGPSGAWRKSIIDRAVASVFPRLLFSLLDTHSKLLQVVRETWWISCRRSCPATLHWRSLTQR